MSAVPAHGDLAFNASMAAGWPGGPKIMRRVHHTLANVNLPSIINIQL